MQYIDLRLLWEGHMISHTHFGGKTDARSALLYPERLAGEKKTKSRNWGKSTKINVCAGCGTKRILLKSKTLSKLCPPIPEKSRYHHKVPSWQHCLQWPNTTRYYRNYLCKQNLKKESSNGISYVIST